MTPKLTKKQITELDWRSFNNTNFEVYGVENYLNDYGNEQDLTELTGRLLNSKEKEFFISSSFPISTGDEEILSFKTAAKVGFYY